nr:unnamed protein product [Spirometra erinaceieuropaei]
MPTDLVGQLPSNCRTQSAPTVASPSTYSWPPMPSTNSEPPPEPSIPKSSSSSLTASTSVAVASVTHISIAHDLDAPTNTNTTTVDISEEDPVYTCPHCDRSFISNVGPVGHFRIHRTETGEPVPGAPAYTFRIRHYRPHYINTRIHRMGPFDHLRIHESGIDRNLDAPITSSKPTIPRPTLTPPPCVPTATGSTKIPLPPQPPPPPPPPPPP